MADLTKLTHFKRLQAYGLLILAQATVGVNIVGSKYLVASISLLFLLTARFFIATFLLFGLHSVAGNKENTVLGYLQALTKLDWIFIVAQALTAGVFFNFLMIWGLKYTDANVAGIITSALPAITAVMSWLVLKERFTFKTSLSLGFATLGLVIISLDKLSVAGSTHSFFGDLIILVALIPEAGYYVLSKWHHNRLPIFLIAAIMNGINALILIPVWLVYTGGHYPHLSLAQGSIVTLIGISSGLFYVCWYSGSAKVEAAIASLSLALMPILTVLIAWFALGELISGVQLIGMMMVIISIVIYVLI